MIRPNSSEFLNGALVRSLMRKHGRTIPGLAASMNITQARVRRVRAHGVEGQAFVRDWLEALTGVRHPYA